MVGTVVIAVVKGVVVVATERVGGGTEVVGMTEEETAVGMVVSDAEGTTAARFAETVVGTIVFGRGDSAVDPVVARLITGVMDRDVVIGSTDDATRVGGMTEVRTVVSAVVRAVVIAAVLAVVKRAAPLGAAF